MMTLRKKMSISCVGIPSYEVKVEVPVELGLGFRV